MQQTISQQITDEIDWSKKEEPQLWVDVSIQSGILGKKEIARLCEENDMKKRSAEYFRQMYYKEWRPLGFDDYWMEEFKKHFKKKASARVYSKLDSLLSDARKIADVVQAGEFLEGKQPGVAVQINNVLGDKKSKYGL